MRNQWVVASAVLGSLVAAALLLTMAPASRSRRIVPVASTESAPAPMQPSPTLPVSATPVPPPVTTPPAARARTDVPHRETAALAEVGRFLSPPALGIGGVTGALAGGVPGGVVSGFVGGRPFETDALKASRRPESKDELRERALPRFNTEAYDRIRDNAFLAAATNPLSTFSIDVDTASYANVRRFLESGTPPPKDAVRIEELLNYFRYDYPQPAGAAPFSVTSEVFGCPWAPRHSLVLIGLQGRTLDQDQVPPRNLVFLLDVSGSMNEPRKLPLLKASLQLLVDQLRPQDRVAIVVYAGASGLVLEPTPGDRKQEIRDAIARLEAGGSTAGGAGIQLAYEVAARSFVAGGVNRVVLGTDGDFNVGITNQGDLVRLIEEKRKSGVFLSVLGFGAGNLKDSTMEKLADSGNGNYAYIDSLAEGRKVLVQEAGATLVTIAKDVKIQVEFNPARAAAYRLIGYENRVLAAEDFNDDTKDAGEIGAGHSVTALYEVVPQGVAIELPGVDPLKYQRPAAAAAAATGDELLTLKLRHKEPDGERSRLLSVVVKDERVARPSVNARFAAAVAGFGMLLRDSEHKGAASWPMVEELAAGALGADTEGYRAQFRGLVRLARSLDQRQHVTALR